MDSLEISPLSPIQFYKVNISKILEHPSAIYHSPIPVLESKSYSKDDQAPEFFISPDQIVILDERQAVRLSKEVPPSTLEYYRFEKLHGRRPLVFNGIPHIFLKGEIDISDCEIVDWTEN